MSFNFLEVYKTGNALIYQYEKELECEWKNQM